MARTDLTRMAPPNFASGRLVPVRLAPRRLAPFRLAERRLTPARLAPARLAPGQEVWGSSRQPLTVRGPATAACAVRLARRKSPARPGKSLKSVLKRCMALRKSLIRLWKTVKDGGQCRTATVMRWSSDAHHGWTGAECSPASLPCQAVTLSTRGIRRTECPGRMKSGRPAKHPIRGHS